VGASSKKRKKALALKYASDDEAPRIVAKGQDRLADVILKVARDSGIHIEDDAALADMLMQFDVGDYIPEEVYEVVAQILAFVYRLDL
jgi:flagellar biosynthesis protein